MPLGSSWTRFASPTVLFVLALVAATGVLTAASYYAFGYEGPSRALNDTIAVVTDHPLLWIVFVSVTWLGDFVWAARNERRKKLKATLVALRWFFVGCAAVFCTSILFLTPRAMLDTARADAEQARQREQEALRRASEATVAREAAEKRAVEAEARLAGRDGAGRVDLSGPTPDPNLVAARQAHLQSLRAVLRDDARQLAAASGWMATGGYRFAEVRPQDLAANEASEWNGNVLMSDFAPHFPAYAAQRAQLQKDVSNHDARVRQFAQRLSNQLQRPKLPEDDRTRVAYAVIHKCSRNSFGMTLETRRGGGYDVSYSTGSSGGNGAGPVPENIAAAWDAFRNFLPDTAFGAECEAISRAADELARRLAATAKEASVLAEVTTLQGNCRYLRVG